MTSRTVNADLDAWFADVNGGSGNGNGTRMSVGEGLGGGAYPFKNRCALRFPRGTFFDGVVSADDIARFTINLRVDNANVGLGSAVRLFFERGTTGFTEYQLVAGQGGVGSNINAYVSSAGPASGEWPGPSRDSANRGSYSGSPSSGAWIAANALALGKAWYAHPEWGSLIIVVVAANAGLSDYDETTTSRRATFYTRETSSKPYVAMSFGGNHPPDKPTVVIVTPGADGTSFTISTTYSDADGDPSPRFEVVFDPD